MKRTLPLSERSSVHHLAGDIPKRARAFGGSCKSSTLVQSAGLSMLARLHQSFIKKEPRAKVGGTLDSDSVFFQVVFYMV